MKYHTTRKPENGRDLTINMFALYSLHTYGFRSASVKLLIIIILLITYVY